MEDKLTTTPKNTRKNIPIADIVHYAKLGLSTREIAKQVECDHSNIVRRLQAYGYQQESVDRYKKNRADILAFTGSKVNDLLTSSLPKIKTAKDYKDLATAFGIIYDKERLESGQSTSNVSMHVSILDHAEESERSRRAAQTPLDTGDTEDIG